MQNWQQIPKQTYLSPQVDMTSVVKYTSLKKQSSDEICNLLIFVHF